MTSNLKSNDPTGWREFIENVIEGKNYFRTGEYIELLEQLETVTRERDEALSKLNAVETSAPRCRHDWSALRNNIHECLKGCGAFMSRAGVVYSPEEPSGDGSNKT